MSIRDNADEITREARRLGMAMPIEVTDTRLRSREYATGTLFLCQATSGIGIGSDPQAAARHSRAAVDKFFGRFGERTAMADTVEGVLKGLGLLETTNG